MAIGANSYGDTAEIAGLTPRWANKSGLFDGSTRPTLTNVESNVDQVSGILNVCLSKEGFTIPVSQADAKLSLDIFVNQEVAAIVEGINGSGRFGPTAKEVGKRGRWALIMDDAKLFISENAAGFERLGVPRPYSETAGLGYRDTDESGDETFPIRQRKEFGNQFTNWDSG